MKIRRKVSQIIGYRIPENGWDKAFEDLEKDGRIGAKERNQILVELLKREEQREQ